MICILPIQVLSCSKAKTLNIMRSLKLFSFLLPLLLPLLSISQTKVDTINVLKTNRTKPAFYKAPNGKIYPVKFVADPSAPFTTQSIKCGEDLFSGKHRAKAKTSFVKGVPVKSFSSILKLISSLTADAEMQTKLTKSSPRIAEENIRVRLTSNIFLYAMKKEADNDYHVIIGDNKVKSKATLLNVEISGVPKTSTASAKAAIQKVRDFFEDNFVELCGSKYAVFSTKPIPIAIEGSMFFDIDHPAGQVGPTGLRPKTAWEIHPISKIVFK